MNIEKLESRIAPAAITVVSSGNSGVAGGNGWTGTNNNPHLTPIDQSLVFTFVAFEPAAAIDASRVIPGPDGRDLTAFANLTTITHITGRSGSPAGLSGLDVNLLGSNESALSELISPLLQESLPESVSSDSIAAVLGLDRPATAAFPGTVELLADSSSAPLMASLR